MASCPIPVRIVLTILPRPAVLDILAGMLISFGCLTLIGALTSHIHWVFDFVGLFLLFGFWALVAGLCILLYRRAWRYSFNLLMVIAIVFFGPLGVRFGAEKATDAEPQITTYQHNVYAQNTQRHSLAEGIRAAKADLVVLLEASPRHFNGYLRPIMGHYPHRISDPVIGSRLTRIQVLSNFAIEKQLLKRTKNGAAILIGRFEFEGQAVHLVVLHFGRPWPFDLPARQMTQTSEVVAELSQIKGPMLVMGDFNSPPWGRVVKQMEKGLGLKVQRPGLAATWPGALSGWMAPKALGIPIDLVLTREGANIEVWQTGVTHGSDHRVVTYDVGIRPTSP